MAQKRLVLAAILALAATPALAQSASGTGSITILRPLSVAKNTDLAFGAVVRPSTGSGSAAISAAGARSVTGGVTGLSAGATPAAAQFTVTGEGGQSISVTVPSTFTMTDSSSNTLTVTTANDLVGSASTQALSNTVGSAGTLVVRVGGSVTIASTTPTGAYSGAFTVAAAYN